MQKTGPGYVHLPCGVNGEVAGDWDIEAVAELTACMAASLTPTATRPLRPQQCEPYGASSIPGFQSLLSAALELLDAAAADLRR